jgi:hypothetical protein
VRFRAASMASSFLIAFDPITLRTLFSLTSWC